MTFDRQFDRRQNYEEAKWTTPFNNYFLSMYGSSFNTDFSELLKSYEKLKDSTHDFDATLSIYQARINKINIDIDTLLLKNKDLPFHSADTFKLSSPVDYTDLYHSGIIDRKDLSFFIQNQILDFMERARILHTILGDRFRDNFYKKQDCFFLLEKLRNNEFFVPTTCNGYLPYFLDKLDRSRIVIDDYNKDSIYIRNSVQASASDSGLDIKVIDDIKRVGIPFKGYRSNNCSKLYYLAFNNE
ncbi:MAG: hypothetical protein ACXVOH_02620 [Bacteroidia bacterium]